MLACVGTDLTEPSCIYSCQKGRMVELLWKNNMRDTKVKIGLPYDPAIQLCIYIYTDELGSGFHRNMVSNVHYLIIYHVQDLKAS